MATPPAFFLLALLAVAAGAEASPSDRRAYIVYMGELPSGVSTADVEASHRDLLLDPTNGGEEDAPSTKVLHHYKRSFSGFSAMLTEEQAKAIRGREGVVSVFRSRYRKPQTTRSWGFLDLPAGAARPRTSVESDVIVGVIDTGISPESKSFDDAGIGPPPSGWKGACQTSPTFKKCNNKIIGARYYHSARDMDEEKDIPSPVDSAGHGSHTASTVAGREVAGIGLYGLAAGTGRGAVPSARLAVYKVCWSDDCLEADILAAFDDAIADGVGIISVSVGGSNTDYFDDVMSIGAFHAMKRGILSSLAAGNGGPSPASVTNVSPWMITVAASTIDRRFVADAELGDGKAYEGIAINTFDLHGKMYPLIHGGDTAKDTPTLEDNAVRSADDESMDENLIKGRIVLCDSWTLGTDILTAGGVGAITRSTAANAAAASDLPATALTEEQAALVLAYINSTTDPVATIAKSRQVDDPKAPYVASFSSRGPNTISRILKPDITAPGVDIIAAWSPLSTVTSSDVDKRRVPYNIVSGTSMACPHVSGAAAYVKSFHPTWSPAAIKSALMTTAIAMGASNSGEFGYGSGNLNPVEAVRPGLVYDADEGDYVRFLCAEGYDRVKLSMVTGDGSSCSDSGNATVEDLNYPSFVVLVEGSGATRRSFRRTVTNVGSPNSVYRATVDAPPAVKVVVKPSVLAFQRLQEQQSYVLTVTLEEKVGAGDRMVSASLTWGDGVYRVRSPIVAYAHHAEDAAG